MANNISTEDHNSTEWRIGQQLATSPSIGLVVSIGSNIVLHTVLNELHEVLKIILTGIVSDICFKNREKQAKVFYIISTNKHKKKNCQMPDTCMTS